MRLLVDIKGLAQLDAALRDFSERRVQAAVATALTRTARRVSQDWQQAITSSVDRPTARTQSAVTFLGARADNLVAKVLLKDRMNGTTPAEYLGTQERGGRRSVKKFEQALIASGAMPSGWVTVPGKGAKLDAYGNVSRSLIIAVIAQLGQDYSPGYAQTISKSTSKRLATAARRGLQFIVVRPGDEKAANADAGIYERQADGRRKAIFIFRRAATYRKRLDLLGDGAKRAGDVLKVEVSRAFSESAARLAAKGRA